MDQCGPLELFQLFQSKVWNIAQLLGESCLQYPNPIRNSVFHHNCYGISTHFYHKQHHCVKSVNIRSYSGPYFPAFGLNTERYGILVLLSPDARSKDQNNSEYGHFLRGACDAHTLQSAFPYLEHDTSVHKELHEILTLYLMTSLKFLQCDWFLKHDYVYLNCLESFLFW